MNSRKRKGQLESMIGKIFVLSLFLILLVNLIVPNKEKSEEENRMLETKPKASAASIISSDHFIAFDAGSSAFGGAYRSFYENRF